MSVRDALSSLPSKPVLFIGPVIIVLVLSFYYRDQYEKCLDIRQSRQSITEKIRSLKPGSTFRFTEVTDFSWNKVRIVAQVEPGTISATCPLDWNWSSGERESLLNDGLLAAVIFGQQGKVVKYLELRADELKFVGASATLSPESAVFDVGKSNLPSGPVTLTLRQIP